jgi:hypothetical protein
MPREFTASQQARLFNNFRAAGELIRENDLDKAYAPASTIPAINSQIALLAAEDAVLGEAVAAIQAVADSALQPNAPISVFELTITAPGTLKTGAEAPVAFDTSVTLKFDATGRLTAITTV